jgi:hypothetical protein
MNKYLDLSNLLSRVHAQAMFAKNVVLLALKLLILHNVRYCQQLNLQDIFQQ